MMPRCLILCCLIPLTAAICFAQSGPDFAAKVLSVQGTVEVFISNDWSPAQVDQELPQGAQVRTGPRSRAVLLLADETMHKLASESTLTLKSVRQASGWFPTARGVLDSVLELVGGRSWIRSKKTPVRMTIETPSVTAAVRGTEVGLEVRPDGESLITVVDGLVDLENPQGRLSLGAGEQGRARVGEAPTKTVLVNPRDAVQWTLFYTASVSPRDYPFQTFSAEQAASQAETSSDAVGRARLLYDAGRLNEALAALEGQAGSEAALTRGWVLLAQNQPREALGELQQASDSTRGRLGLSLAYLQLGDTGQAYGVVSDGTDAQLLVQRAWLDLLAGQVEAARMALERIEASDRFYALAQGLLSDVLVVGNRQQEALSAASRAVEAQPGSPSAHLALSRARQSLLDLPGAKQAAEDALTQDPFFVAARLQLATLLFGEGRTKQAEQIVRRVVAEAPNEALGHSLLGFILLARGKSEEARGSFEQALRLDSARSQPRLGLGLLEMRAGRSREGGLRIMEAATLDPQISLYQSYLAKAFYEQREIEQAFGALESAKQLDPRDPTPHLYSGIFSNDLNRPGQAVGDFEESIRLNDNRAVYRSRFLLDQDRATRNVQLATAFRRLGLTAWANQHAIRSNLEDAASSGARLFLADTFLNSRGGTLAGGSELLWVRLLSPPNVNSFNSFNDYTTLFERPRLDLTLEGRYSSFDTANGAVLVSGGASRIAYQTVFSYDRTAGFRPVNDNQKSYTAFSNFKFALTPSSDILLSYAHLQTDQGDPSASPLVNDRNDPNLNVFSRFRRFEVGYHQRLRPGSEIVVLFSGREEELLFEDPDFPSPFLRPPPETVQLRRSQRIPNLSLQAAHIFRFENVQLRYGFDWFEGRTRTRNLIRFINFRGDEEVQEFPRPTRVKDRFKTAFAHADVQLTPRLTATLGLNYDWSNDDNALDATQVSLSRWNPQGGLIFTPRPETTLRFGAARIFQTHLQESLTPSHVMGFPFNRNEFPLTESRSVEAAWDQIWNRRTFSRVSAFHRDGETPGRRRVSRNVFENFIFDGDSYGGQAELNRFLTDRLTVLGRYEFEHADGLFSGLRHEHRFRLGAFFVSPLGLSWRVEEEFFDQNGRFGASRTDVRVWTTDAQVSYELPGKRGLLAVRVRNLFDRRYEFLADPLALDPRRPRRQIEGLLRLNF